MPARCRLGRNQQQRHHSTSRRQVHGSIHYHKPQRKNHCTPNPQSKKRHHDPHAWPPNSRTPRPGWNPLKNAREVLVAQDEGMDRRLRKGMRNLSAKQNPHSPTKDTSIPDTEPNWYLTILKCSHRLNNGTPGKAQPQCYPHHCWPRMLSCSSIPTMQHDDHRSGYCPTILR